ncbi:MAG: 23S rRNA (pseudouridine(1915)-N(3))-methyltransferase RlmH [Desulfotomaculaceae bacterium]|nr:23S rRNA (pseudouridine(1915)-N(3))-methyltransferase RlmH [Desulfotomaculaceae bacterium]
MYHISILAVGRLKERYLIEGAAEYLKRLTSYTRIEVHEVNDESFSDKTSPAECVKVKEIEGGRLIKRLRRDTYLIALDRRGRIYDSEEMAGILGKLALGGRGDITFIIGGSLGLSKAVLDRANMLLSFSSFTFPHQLMRIVLLEQIFRWLKIARGEQYHR